MAKDGGKGEEKERRRERGGKRDVPGEIRDR